VPATTWMLLVDGAPAPPQVVGAIRDAVVEVDLELAGVLRLTLGVEAGHDRWGVVDDGVFGQRTRLTLLAVTGPGIPTPLIDAYVAETTTRFSSAPGDSELEVIAYDVTSVMNAEVRTRSWPNMPDQAIATVILGEHGLVPQTAPTSPVRTVLDTTTVQRDTDIRFLRRLAWRNGFDVYVAPTPVPGVTRGVFGPPLLDAPHTAVLTVGMGDAATIPSLSVRHDRVRTAASTAANVDARAVRATDAGVESTSRSRLGARGDEALRRGRVRPDGVADSGGLTAVSQAEVDRAAWAVTGTGTVDATATGIVLGLGDVVGVRGIGRTYSGRWQVSRLRHHLTVERHTQDVTLRRNATGLTGTEVFIPELGLPG
jgi:phage protein D